MQYEVSRHYISLCDTYGWQPTLAGLLQFERLVKGGVYGKWTSPRVGRKPHFKWQQEAQHD